MPKSNGKTIKKAVRTTTAQTAKAPSKGATIKSIKTDVICQRIIKSFETLENIQIQNTKKVFGETDANFNKGVAFTYQMIRECAPFIINNILSGAL